MAPRTVAPASASPAAPATEFRSTHQSTDFLTGARHRSLAQATAPAAGDGHLTRGGSSVNASDDPQGVDWVAAGVVTPVRDQGLTCGES